MFFVIWHGWGLVVLPVFTLPLLAVQLVVNGVFGSGYYSTHHWTICVASLLSSAALWITGRQLEKYRDRTNRVLVDEKTGERIVLKSRDALFFIPVKYWAFVEAATGLVFAFTI